MYDGGDAVFVAGGHGDGAAGEERDAGYGCVGQHGVEDGGADEASGAGEDEVHFGVVWCFDGRGKGCVVLNGRWGRAAMR